MWRRIYSRPGRARIGAAARWAILAAALAMLGTALTATAAQSAPPAKPALSVNDVTVTEGDAGTTDATFTVSASLAAKKAVTVDYATADGSATAGSDYVPSSGTLVFARGQTSNQVTVKVNGDTADEPDETFLLVLSNPTNAVIDRGTGAATIQDDDEPPPAGNVVQVPITAIVPIQACNNNAAAGVIAVAVDALKDECVQPDPGDPAG
jgi:hypothetical protein